MKNIFVLFLSFFLLVSCKKDRVDATNPKAFQESINDMASSLSTLQQVKFNEALYILKTFGVEGENEMIKIKNLGNLLNGKNVAEILTLADQVATQNEIAWSSTAPPSLGEMNIFGALDNKASEFDPNDIKAKSLDIKTSEIIKDSLSGATGLKIIPRLVDEKGNPVNFSQAGLQTIMEVSSGGRIIYTSKNLMQDNNFSGFTLRYSSFSADKIVEDKIDISVTVTTTKKVFKKSKIGIPINANALYYPTPTDPIGEDENTETPKENTDKPENTTQSTDPKATVSKFLSNLSAQNFKGAYDISDNPNWSSYDKFSNPTSGFGSVSSISVKKISAPNINGNSASVNASYEIKDKEGKSTSLNVTFSLKNTNGEWKISNYQIN